MSSPYCPTCDKPYSFVSYKIIGRVVEGNVEFFAVCACNKEQPIDLEMTWERVAKAADNDYDGDLRLSYEDALVISAVVRKVESP